MKPAVVANKVKLIHHKNFENQHIYKSIQQYFSLLLFLIIPFPFFFVFIDLRKVQPKKTYTFYCFRCSMTPNGCIHIFNFFKSFD